MGTTRLRRPPAPTGAERARSMIARGATASLVGTGARAATPLVHLVRADGSAVLLLADDEPVLDRLRDPGGDSRTGSDSPGWEAAAPEPAMLELADHAPVELREPVRALLWITGRLRLLDPDAARRTAVLVADVLPHPDLLRLGHGATLVRLEPGSAVLSDAEGSVALGPVDLAAARSDPFCRYERPWLAHLEQDHPEVFVALARHLPPALRDAPEARIRPLGLDRCGLRLRVETPDRDHDVRLAWPGRPATIEELRVQVGLLVGCPFRGAAGPIS